MTLVSTRHSPRNSHCTPTRADIPALPGVIAYGSTREEALSNVKALALHVLADMIEHGELGNPPDTVVFMQAAAA